MTQEITRWSVKDTYASRVEKGEGLRLAMLVTNSELNSLFENNEHTEVEPEISTAFGQIAVANFDNQKFDESNIIIIDFVSGDPIVEQIKLIETSKFLEEKHNKQCSKNDIKSFFVNAKHPFEENAQPAKKICQMCVVNRSCLKYALENNEKYGIWGGKTVQERKRIKRAVNRNVLNALNSKNLTNSSN